MIYGDGNTPNRTEPHTAGILTYDNFPYKLLSVLPSVKKRKGNQGRREQPDIVDAVCAFDIETTRIPEIEQSIMYIWQFQFDEYCTVVGRSWEEFFTFLTYISNTTDRTVVVYVHNLSYEFSFLCGILNFFKDDVFCLDSRKVLKCNWRNIEFRCSYKLSNMSLLEYSNKMGVETKKLTGFDYKKMRFPWTELTEDELNYCINDVKSLVLCVRKEMEVEGDNLHTIPLTSTGYIRREAKAALRKFPQQWLKSMLPKWDCYQLIRQAFRGGDTHANRFYTDVIIDGPVYSYDRASSYPHVQLTKKFPMGRFQKIPDNSTLYDVMDMIDRQKRAVVLEIECWNLELSDRYQINPYLNRHKVRDAVGIVEDNGRIYSAKYLKTTLTDIDLKIFLDVYKGRIEFIQGYSTHYGYLPGHFRQLILKYFGLKCELKDVEGQEVYYTKSKNKLNGFYGLSAQNPVRRMYKFVNGVFEIDIEKTQEQLLEEYNKRGYLPYQWGCWTTAHARAELYEMQKIGGFKSLYWDTDSNKILGDADFTEYNKRIIEEDEKTGACYDREDGKRFYLGVAELDGVYDRFKTMGAKKYAVEQNGKLKITIAGVEKKAGAEELEENGGLEAFNSGFTFVKAGGLEAIYNDTDYGWYEIDGHSIYITRNVCLSPSTYTLGLGEKEDYEILLYHSQKLLKLKDEIY